MSNPAEKFATSCPQCGEIMTVSRAHVGKKGRCGICHQVFVIEAPDGVVHRTAAARSAAPASAPVEKDDFDLAPVNEPASSSASPMNAYAHDHLKKAKEYKGSALEQEEADSGYRFATSYGSVIGGIIAVVAGLMLGLFFVLCILSPAGLVLAFTVVSAGIGWIVLGMNYVTYYRWKDKGGRD
jgi:hypothetical protein